MHAVKISPKEFNEMTIGITLAAGAEVRQADSGGAGQAARQSRNGHFQHSFAFYGTLYQSHLPQ